MAKERDGAARVIAQEGSRLQVEHRGERLTVPMQGFPPGFVLRPGARVILRDETPGPVARPLVRAILSSLPPQALESRAQLDVAGRRLEMQEGTLVEEGPRRPDARPSDQYEVWLVEGQEGDPAQQVIAVRRR
jgi:hypothetical protein